MYHPLENRLLYGAVKVTVKFVDDYGAKHTGFGTGFVISHASKAHIVTDRHVVEAGYSEKRKKDWKLTEVSFSGYGNSSDYFQFD